jgi:hypothetical protein
MLDHSHYIDAKEKIGYKEYGGPEDAGYYHARYYLCLVSRKVES